MFGYEDELKERIEELEKALIAWVRMYHADMGNNEAEGMTDQQCLMDGLDPKIVGD